MRTIKFRVWDKDGKIFYFYDISNGFYGLAELLNRDYSRSNFIIQQFTNLQDKNGKDIYEGDILEVELPIQTKISIGIVKYSKKYGYFGVRIVNECVNAPEIPKTFANYVNNDGIFQAKIIGNIFENAKNFKKLSKQLCL